MDYKNLSANLPHGCLESDQIVKHVQFVDVYTHVVSLLHAVALATLRTDYTLMNFEVCSSTCTKHHQKGPLAINRKGLLALQMRTQAMVAIVGA
jgi:hypothetical protein